MQIEISHLRVCLAGKDILHDVNLRLEAGEIHGLIGLNGAGKSTTMAAALRGRLRQRSSIRRRSAPRCYCHPSPPRVLPEKNGFYGWMTARDHLDFSARLYGENRSDRELARRPPSGCSGDWA